MRMILLFILLFTMAIADHDRHHDDHMPLDISYLNLTHAQHEAVEEVVRDYLKARHRFNRKKEATRVDMAALFSAGKFNHERFAALSGTLHNEADAIQSRFLEALHTLLTPQQRRAFASYMQEWEIE